MDRRDEHNLPDSLAIAWGVKAPPTKGPKRSLSIEEVIDAAIELAEREGLDSVSMSRLADSLDLATMALYRYVKAKEELFLLMVDRAVGPPKRSSTRQGWRRRLSAWAVHHSSALHRHPWVLELPVQGLPITPNVAGWFDEGLASLGDVALEEAEKSSILLLVSGYVRNEAMTSVSVMRSMERSGLPPDQAMASYVALMRRVSSPSDLPSLHALLDAGVFDAADDPEDEFLFGLERILDGVELLLQR
jgi:AcrR family transcriptional regulator